MGKSKEKDKEKDILKLAIKRFKYSYDDDQDERTFALDDLKFAHNEDNYQWPQKVKEQRLNDMPPRPCLSLNKLPEKIDQVDGEFRQLKPSFKVRVVDSVSDPKTAEIIAGLIRQIEWNSAARNSYNTSHNSVLHCGRGAWRIDIEDNEEDPFTRDLVINRIPNVFSVFWDPDAKKLDQSDGRYCFITDELSADEFNAQYPDVEPGDWVSEGNEAYPLWKSEKKIRVAEYWYKEKVSETFCRVKRVINEIETVKTIKKEELQEGDEIIEEKSAGVTRVKYCKLIHDKIITGPIELPTKHIPVVIETGKEINIQGKSKKRGMIRHAKTPQQMYNYWSSSQTETIALSPKAPYLATAKMIGNYKDAMWDRANITNFVYLLYDIDPMSPNAYPRREPPPQLSPAMAVELNRMEHDIMSAMNIYKASLGDEGSEDSGKAIYARQKQGSTGSYVYTDNFNAALTYSMKVLISLLPYIYDTERIIRIRGADDVEAVVPINARPDAEIAQGSGYPAGATGYINDLSVGKYDIVVSIGPSYSTQREEMATVLGEIIKSMPPKVGMLLLETFINTMDMPGSDVIIKKLQEITKAEGQPTFDQQLSMKKLELDGLKEMREVFEAKVQAIADLMSAEAKERGQQLNEITAFMQQLQNSSGMKTMTEGGMQ